MCFCPFFSSSADEAFHTEHEAGAPLHGAGDDGRALRSERAGRRAREKEADHEGTKHPSPQPPL